MYLPAASEAWLIVDLDARMRPVSRRLQRRLDRAHALMRLRGTLPGARPARGWPAGRFGSCARTSTREPNISTAPSRSSRILSTTPMRARPVGDQHHGHAALLELEDAVVKREIAVLIEVGARLVEHHQARLAEHGAGKRRCAGDSRPTARRRPRRPACRSPAAGAARDRARPPAWPRAASRRPCRSGSG